MKRLLTIAALLFATSANADEVVRIGSGNALLNKPGNPRGSLILVPGGDGYLGIGSDGSIAQQTRSTLVRNRKALAARGFATILIDGRIGVGQAAVYMRAIAQPIVVVTISRGANRIREIVASNPSGIVLVSAELQNVRNHMGSPASLPRTLVVHHRNDNCHSSLPSIVEPFRNWGSSKVQVEWIAGGSERGHPCRGQSHHGLLGRDGQLNAAIARFAATLPASKPATTAPTSTRGPGKIGSRRGGKGL